MYKKHFHYRGLKYVFWQKKTTAPSQLKITLDTENSVSVDLLYELTKTPRGKFDDL